MKPRLSQERRELIVSLRKEGKTFGQIREETKHAISTIITVLREAGLVPPLKKRVKKVRKVKKLKMTADQITLADKELKYFDDKINRAKHERLNESINYIVPTPVPNMLQKIAIRLANAAGVTINMYKLYSNAN